MVFRPKPFVDHAVAVEVERLQFGIVWLVLAMGNACVVLLLRSFHACSW